MNSVCRVLTGLFLLAAPGWAFAVDARQDYREQWPLQLATPSAGAYRLTLGEAQYRSAVSPQLQDVQVFNAQGQPLPSALFRAETPLAQSAPLQPLPWFALPPQGSAGSDDLQLLTERNTDGSVRRVEARLGRTGSNAQPGGWLVDASKLDVAVQALRLDWQAGPSLQLRVQVDVSADLQSWRRINDDVPLVDLAQDDNRLQQRRIFIGRQARYIRILPVSGNTLPALTSVQAELMSTLPAIDWQWRSLQGKTVAPGEFEYVLDGRFPIAQVDIATADNSAVQWTLQSRDDAGQPWQVRAGPWVAYQLQDSAQRRQSQAQSLAAHSRDRYWKLVAAQGQPAQAPTLKLGYQPETLVFLSQGETPFTVATGSVRAARTSAPVGTVLAQLRAQQGEQWQPAVATVQGPAQVLGGDAAVQPERDWKRWLLWALLGLGVVIVGGFAISLLRTKR
ncbi:DUF3999 domain-containing protein [Stenotrophomonas sp.]|uniref:DUF3999 domain-containing protein n=1 Tax=Stenotrophomonas sp. TaxID=69392 RepID=UPI0028A1A368|nr:DUF3999 domain-containing protein [Stenotrophomonas sp.]